MVMEELLWKYIDNECTSEEIEKVKILLQTDPEFKQMYHEYTELDLIFSQNLAVDLSSQFRERLENSSIKAVSKKQTSIYNLRNIQLAAIIFFTTAIVSTYYFASGDSLQQSQLLAQVFTSLGQETLYLFNIVVISLVTLMTLDWGLKYFIKIKSVVVL
jgi:hypothetical protein